MAASKLSVRLSCALLAAASSMPLSARAQSKDPAAAEALFQQGKEALDRGDYDTACPKLEASLKAEAAPGTLFFLADCEEKQGRIATAWAHFKELEQKLPADDSRRPTVVQRAAALQSRIPKLTVKVASGTPANAVVTRDGIEMGAASLGSPTPIDPGEHTIAIEAPGHARNESKVVIDRPSTEITVSVGERTATGATPAGKGGAQVPVGITIGSIGVAAMVSGVIVGVVGKSNYDDSDPFCDEDDFCGPEGITIREDARTMGTAATVVFAIGAAATATGIIVWLTAPKDEGGLASTNWRVGVGPSGIVARTSW
ncbi:MAG: hypothetical protein HOW73_22105 [Polyangiaceae bacterium]|nr:hypothetical protein [Polyangiaceae bacterium]